MERFIPLRSVRTNPLKPWINSYILKAINKKRAMWDYYSKNRTTQNYEKYKSENNRVKKLITDARKNYENEIAIASGKNFYRYVNRSLHSKVTSLSLKSSNGDIVFDPANVSEIFAHQFDGVFTDEPPGPLPQLPVETRNPNSLETIDFTPEKVFDVIKSLKTDASPGIDNIPPVFLQRCLYSLSAPLAASMSNSMLEGHIPDAWKHAIVTPIFKKGNRHAPENYRPISLTSALSKCMEKTITKEMTNFLLQSNVIPTTQHGFLTNRSIDSNLLSCLNNWTQMHDDGQPIDVVYLDFKKAFDKVPFRRLLYKLDHSGIRGQLLRWIQNFLTGRKFQVRANSVLSKERHVKSGVPQGSVLGPLLFLVYISDMSSEMKSNVSFYADDTKMFTNPTQNPNFLQSDLQLVELWTETWLMSLNVNKCTVLHIGPNNRNNTYLLKGLPLTNVDHQKDLGVIVSNDLKWENHIAMIVKRANSLIYLIRRAFKNHSCNTIMQIYKTYIRPLLEFAVSSWNPYFAKDIEILEKVQRQVTKIPPELKDLPYEERCSRLKLTSLRERRQRGDLIITFKILSGYYSVPLDLYHNGEHIHLRGHNRKLSKEKCSKLCRRNFLNNRVVYVWNRLDTNTVNAPTINTFKNRLDANLLNINRQLVHY